MRPDELQELIAEASTLSEREVVAFVRRADLLLHRQRLPRARGEWPSIPWPPF